MVGISPPKHPDFSPHADFHPPGTVPLVFEPTPEELATLFRALSDPYQCLFDVAANHNTTLPALTAWMARPEVAAQLDTFESATAGGWGPYLNAIAFRHD